MNHTYGTRYNASLGLWRAVPETAKAHGKSKALKVGAGGTAGAALAAFEGLRGLAAARST